MRMAYLVFTSFLALFTPSQTVRLSSPLISDQKEAHALPSERGA